MKKFVRIIFGTKLETLICFILLTIAPCMLPVSLSSAETNPMNIYSKNIQDMMNEKKYDEALNWSRKLLAAAIKTYGPNDNQTGQVYFTMSRCYHYLGNIQASHDLIDKTIATYKKSLLTNNDKINLAYYIGYKGYYYLENKNYSASLKAYIEAYNLAKSAGKDDDGYYYRIAVNSEKLGLYRRAEEIYLNIIEQRKQKFGTISTQYNFAIEWLANVYVKTERISAAEKLYLQSIEITASLTGDTSSTTASKIATLENFYRTIGETTKADIMLKKYNKVREIAYPKQ